MKSAPSTELLSKFAEISTDEFDDFEASPDEKQRVDGLSQQVSSILLF
jgi:hypothetical protein